MTAQNRDVVQIIFEDHDLIRNLIREFENSTGEQRRETWEALLRTLAVHETAEEEIAYPRLRMSVDGGDQLAEPRLAEEDHAKKELAELESMGPDDPQFPARFEQVKEAVLAHAEAEERETWPRLRESESIEVLERMGQAFEAAKAVAPTHPHKMAPESATGNLVLGPFVAVVDRVRDALKGVMEKSRR